MLKYELVLFSLSTKTFFQFIENLWKSTWSISITFIQKWLLFISNWLIFRFFYQNYEYEDKSGSRTHKIKCIFISIYSGNKSTAVWWDHITACGNKGSFESRFNNSRMDVVGPLGRSLNCFSCVVVDRINIPYRWVTLGAIFRFVQNATFIIA